MRVFLLLLFTTLFLSAQTLTSELLSPEKQHELELQKKQSQLQSDILRDSWIAPLNSSYSNSYNNQFGLAQQSTQAYISIDQPIFKSGGIYFGIKYAQANTYYKELGLVMQEKALIKEVMALILNLRKLDLQIQKATLSLQDAQENADYQRERLNAGELDIGQYNLTLIAQNSAKEALITLKNSREDLLFNFFRLSSVDYKTLPLAHFTLVDNSTFLASNTDLLSLQKDIEQKEYASFVTLTSYLPTLSAQAGYNYSASVNKAFSATQQSFDAESQYFSYGFRLSMPLAFNSLRDIESAQVATLIAKTQLGAKKEEVKRFYAKTKAKVQGIHELIALSNQNIELYAKVLVKAKAQYDAGESSIIALNQVKNSVTAKRLDVAMYKIDEQIELLNLYERLYEARP